MENKKIHTLLFYKFIDLGKQKQLEKFRKQHLKECKNLGLLGRILISKEGINGSVSGTKEQVEEYKKMMKSKEGFEDLWFKEDTGIAHPFTKMKILVREEIVSLKKPVDLSKTGNYLEPEQVLDLYDENGNLKDDVIILDARNDYEYKVGRFKDAIQINTKTFREFPEKVKELEKIPDAKNKKVVMYCTGGIRCEKASVVLKEAGFKNVNQINGGIINFVQKYPDTFWEGNLFVFDKRLVTPVNTCEDPISKCESCGKLCDLYKNCRNDNCDRLVILCINCQKELIGCCSQNCLKELKKQFLEKSKRKQGRKVSQAC